MTGSARWLLLSDEFIEGAGTVTTPVQVASGSGAVTVPVYTGNGAVTTPVQVAAGSGSVVNPVYTGDGVVAIPVQTVSGSGSVTVPVYTGNGTLTTLLQAASGAGDVVAPVYTGDGAVAVPVHAVAGSGEVVAPIYSGAGAVSIAIQAIEGSGSFEGTEEPETPLIRSSGWIDDEDWRARYRREREEARRKKAQLKFERGLLESYTKATEQKPEQVKEAPAPIKAIAASPRSPARAKAIASKLAQSSDPAADNLIARTETRIKEISAATQTIERLEREAVLERMRDEEEAISILMMVS